MVAWWTLNKGTPTNIPKRKLQRRSEKQCRKGAAPAAAAQHNKGPRPKDCEAQRHGTCQSEQWEGAAGSLSNTP
eukprot:3053609-Amphidinium_carterae.1